MGYGALQVEDEPQKLQSFRKSVAVAFAGMCVVCAVVGFSTVSSNSTYAAINANRNKGTLAAVPGVLEKTQEVLNMTENGLRYAIFSFIPCCDDDCSECKIIPTVQGKASADWTEDWQSFVNALPEDEVAAAVYNFEYFVDESTSETKPVLITWAPPGTENKDLARAGYYLGSVILATDGVHSHYPLQEIHETYNEFCTEVVGISDTMCSLEGRFHNCPFIPFAGVGKDGNPCEAKVCDGAAFVNPDSKAANDEGIIPAECCTFITEWCHDGENVSGAGCHPTTLRSVTRLCDNKEIDETPELILPKGEEELCEDTCIEPCVFFSDPNDTWKKCSGCPTDGLIHKGKSYQCYPGGHGFEEYRCCGVADECTAKAAQSDMSCNTLEDFDCVWVEHLECADIIREQKEEVEESAGEAEAEEQ